MVLLPPVNDASVHVGNQQGKVIIQLIARKVIVATLPWNSTTHKEVKPLRASICWASFDWLAIVAFGL